MNDLQSRFRIRDALASMRIVARSPSRSVRAQLTSEGVSVDLARGFRDRHDETALENEIEAALSEVLRAYSVNIEYLRSRTEGRRTLSLSEDDIPVRRRQFAKACAEIEAKGVSPREFVTIAWHGRETFMVVLREDSLRRLEDEELLDELNAALRQCALNRSSQVAANYQVVQRSSI